MARLVVSFEFLAQKLLLDSIKTKHTADGASSVLTSYLTSHGINMATAVAAGTQALAFDAQSKQLHKQAENFREQRDNAFRPVFSTLRDMVQFLKGFYRGNVSALGDWGITINLNNRVVYPSDFAQRQSVLNLFLAKHASYAAGTSPLQPYLTLHAIVPANLTAAATAAQTSHNSVTTAQNNAELATENRNNTWAPVWAQVLGIGQFLMNLFEGNQKQLGLWGFTVDSNIRKAIERQTTLQLGRQITINTVVLGSLFKNTGTVDIHLYRGTLTHGTPIIVHPGQEIGIQKGFSTITLVNPDTLNPASFTTLRHR